MPKPKTFREKAAQEFNEKFTQFFEDDDETDFRTLINDEPEDIKSFWDNKLREQVEEIKKELPKEKDFKGWHTAHSQEEWVERTDAYSWNQCLSEIKSIIEKYEK